MRTILFKHIKMGINIYFRICKHPKYRQQFNYINKLIERSEGYQRISEMEEIVESISFDFYERDGIGYIYSGPKISYHLSYKERQNIARQIEDFWEKICSTYFRGEVALIDGSEVWDEGEPRFFYNGDYTFCWGPSDFILQYSELILTTYNKAFEFTPELLNKKEEEYHNTHDQPLEIQLGDHHSHFIQDVTFSYQSTIDKEEIYQHFLSREGKKSRKLMEQIKLKYKKIMVWGSGGVGKKTLLRRHLDKKFYSDSWLTKGVEHFTESLKFKDQRLTLIYWVLAGQERFRFFQHDLIKGADAAILLFDLSRWPTFNYLGEFIKMLHTWNNTLPIILVGAKGDLQDKGSLAYGKKYPQTLRQKFNLSGYIGTSSKMGINVDLVFDLLFEDLFST